MSTFSKKFVSVALTATTAVWASGALLLVPTAANAATTADLQAQIAALLAQISQLQAQLNAGGSAGASTTFTRDLTVGAKGADVTALQQVLFNKGFLKVSPTGYFGALTKAAVAAWQVSAGISPAAGYVGPKSRAALNAMGGVVVTPPGTPPPTPTSAPASGLAVSLSAKNPAAGSLIAGAGRTPVLAVDLTAGTSGAVTVTGLMFKKNGVVADNGVAGAYIVDASTGAVIAQYSSISGGVITFSGTSINVNAGQTRTIYLAIDPAAGLSAGNTVSFSLVSADNINSVDSNGTAITETGSFPVNGNIFTITTVSNPSIATLTVTSSSIGTTVNAGSQGVLVSAWTFNVANSPVTVNSLTFKVVGSADKGDIRNLTLKINGAAAGTVVANANTGGGAVTFDLSASPVKLNTGNNTIQVFADVMGSPNRSFNLGFYDSFNLYVIDTQYNTPIKVTLTDTTSATITINAGSLTFTLSNDTPTGNIAKGGSNVPLIRVKVYAAGEALRVKYLSFQLAFTGAAAAIDSQVRNMSLTDDRGNQVGSTINLMSTTATCTDGTYSAATSTATNCFGNSASPINYVIPANTAVVLTLKGDIQSGADFSSIVASFVAGTNNLVGVTSSNNANSSAITGSVLTLAANSLTVAANAAVGTQTVAKGAQGVVVGSYTLTASSAEGVNLSSITILTSASSTNFQNLKLMSGGQQFGTTQPVLTASASYTFSGAITVPAGQTKTVDVVADVLTGTAANTYATVTTLSACSGQGATTFTSISCTSTSGQSLTVAGQATLRATVDTSASPAAQQLVMGSTGNTLAAFNLGETSNIEDLKVTDMYVYDLVGSTSTAKSGTWSSLGMYLNGQLVGTTVTPTAASSSASGGGTAGPSYMYHFTFANPVTVPKNNSITLLLKGDVASYSSSGVTDNSTHTFKLATSSEPGLSLSTSSSNIVTYGKTSNATSAVTLASPGAANTMTVLRSKVTVSAATLGLTSGRSKNTNDNLGTITFTSDPAGRVAVNTVTITFTGSAVTTTSTVTTDLLDANGNSVILTSGVTSSTAATTKSWNFGAANAGWGIGSTGSTGTYTFTIRVNDGTGTTPAGANGVAQSYTATYQTNTDITYTDATDGNGTTNLSPPTNAAPLTIASVSFSAGQ